MSNALPHSIALALWRRALETEIGIAIPTDDRRWLQRHLYEARQASGDETLQSIIMLMPGESNEVWLCKKTAEVIE